MVKKNVSTYFFIGRLSDYTAEYQVQNFPVVGNYILEIFMSGISLWGNTVKPFEEVRSEVIQILDTITATFTYLTNKTISYRLENWVEAKEQIAQKNIIGWLRPPNTPVSVRSTRSPINTAWKTAAKSYRKLANANRNYMIALQDYRSAINHVGDDAFFYAYRAIEDICRAVSGLQETDIKAWQIMHQKIGSSLNQIKPLKEVSDEVRHGKRDTIIIVQARKQKAALIKLSHDVMEKAFRAAFSGSW